jgi:flagellar hook-associated protein 2
VVLTSTRTGSDHAITVTSSGGDGGLNALSYDPANSNTNLKELTKAGDATVSVDGYTYTSPSNEVTDSIPGVTLDLTTAKPGTVLNLTIAGDTSGAAKAVQSFVSAYNALNNVMKSYTAYNPTTNTASALTGDSLASSIASQVRRALSATTPGATGGVRSLFDLGVSSNDDGTLSVDAAKLTTALTGNAGAAAALFAKTGAIGSTLQNALDGFIGSNGVLPNRATTLTKNLSNLSTQQADLNTRMDKLTTLYKSQYTALDTLMSQLTNMSSFLTTQFNSLSKNSS